MILGFGPKNSKRWYFGAFRYALEQFGVLLYQTKDAPTQIITAPLEAKRAETLKKAIL